MTRMDADKKGISSYPCQSALSVESVFYSA